MKEYNDRWWKSLENKPVTLEEWEKGKKENESDLSNSD